jgi:hypothetical protein
MAYIVANMPSTLSELYWRAMPAEDAERAHTPPEAALSFPYPGESV